MGNEEERIPLVLVRSVMSVYEGAKTRVIVDSKLSQEFEVNVGMHRGPVLSHFLQILLLARLINRQVEVFCGVGPQF